VLSLSPEKIGTFDLVLFLGVLYHMRHPILSLEKMASVTAPGGMVIIETQVDLLEIKRPALAFYPESELNGDATNWFGPNPPAIEGMLRTVGFQKVVAHSPLPPAAYPETIVQRRMVFHAWK
jgi:tRNA (mo5U34)-methyltransferase